MSFILLMLSATGAQDEGFRWRTDLDAARVEARQSGRPLCVVFR